MQLPLAGNLQHTRTGYRLARPMPTSLGLYADTDAGVDHVTSLASDVFRAEVRIGAQYAINPNRGPDHREQVVQDVNGLIMRHVYGPIYDELVGVMKAMLETGTYRGDPAFDRVTAMMDTLGAAFRGRC